MGSEVGLVRVGRWFAAVRSGQTAARAHGTRLEADTSLPPVFSQTSAGGCAGRPFGAREKGDMAGMALRDIARLLDGSLSPLGAIVASQHRHKSAGYTSAARRRTFGPMQPGGGALRPLELALDSVALDGEAGLVGEVDAVAKPLPQSAYVSTGLGCSGTGSLRHWR
jgi:hypothetical protein